MNGPPLPMDARRAHPLPWRPGLHDSSFSFRSVHPNLMSNDPFERFERSRSGWLIPLLLFVLGAIPTTFAIRAIDDLDSRQSWPRRYRSRNRHVRHSLPILSLIGGERSRIERDRSQRRSHRSAAKCSLLDPGERRARSAVDQTAGGTDPLRGGGAGGEGGVAASSAERFVTAGVGGYLLPPGQGFARDGHRRNAGRGERTPIRGHW